MLSNWLVGLDVNSHLFLLAFFYLTDQSESDQYLRVVVERWFQIFAATSILNICCYLQTVSFISRLFVVESLDACMNEFQQNQLHRVEKLTPKRTGQCKNPSKNQRIYIEHCYIIGKLLIHAFGYTLYTLSRQGYVFFHECPYLTHDACPSFIYVVFTLVLWKGISYGSINMRKHFFFLLFS